MYSFVSFTGTLSLRPVVRSGTSLPPIVAPTIEIRCKFATPWRLDSWSIPPGLWSSRPRFARPWRTRSRTAPCPPTAPRTPWPPCCAREALKSTAVGRGVALPHGYLDGLTEPVLVFVRLGRPLDLGAPDGVATQFLFLLLGPRGDASEHLRTLADLARLTSDDTFLSDAEDARAPEALLAGYDRYLARTNRAPESAPAEPVGLAYTGRFCGGLMQDVRRRLPDYGSDFRDGLNIKSSRPRCSCSSPAWRRR